nr:RNA-directed DNA polymerase, eukaryota, reverse transcriptase zinc-binding domain protein [Tanacetum cinerariifolium]
MQHQGVNFFEYIRLKLGNGDNMMFWEDKWCEGGVLKDLFSCLYALELMRKSTVSVKLSESMLENYFRRKVRSGVEEAQLGDLYELISTITLSSSVDRYVWSLENSREFSVASIRKIIDGKRFQDVTSLTRWVKSMPIKAKLKSVFEGIFYGLWWSIWNFRNKLLFEKEAPSQAVIFDNIVSISFNWYRCKIGLSGQYSPPFLPCGRIYLVKCISGTEHGACVFDEVIQVTIVDYAITLISQPSDEGSTMVLSATMFGFIANSTIDSISIEFK